MSRDRSKAWAAFLVAALLAGATAFACGTRGRVLLQGPGAALAAAFYERMAGAYAAGLAGSADVRAEPVRLSRAGRDR
jgi:hypothetical protein